jgi:hypothetical protein
MYSPTSAELMNTAAQFMAGFFALVALVWSYVATARA